MANEIKSVSLIAYPQNTTANNADPEVLINKGYVDGFYGEGAWSEGGSYNEGDIVVYNGKLYKAGSTLDATKTPNQSGSGWTATSVFGAIQTASAGVVVASSGVISVPNPTVSNNITTYTVGLTAGDGIDGTTAGTIKVKKADSSIDVSSTGVKVNLNSSWSGLKVDSGLQVDAVSTQKTNGTTNSGKVLKLTTDGLIDTSVLPNLAITEVFVRGAQNGRKTFETGTGATYTHVEKGDVVIEEYGGNKEVWMYVGESVKSGDSGATTTLSTDTNWKQINVNPTYALSSELSSLSGTVSSLSTTVGNIRQVPSCSNNDNGKVLTVVSGSAAWAASVQSLGITDGSTSKGISLGGTATNPTITVTDASTSDQGTVKLVTDIFKSSSRTSETLAVTPKGLYETLLKSTNYAAKPSTTEATTYVYGQLVRRGTTPVKIYRCIQGYTVSANTTDSNGPVVGGNAYWQDLGIEFTDNLDNTVFNTYLNAIASHAASQLPGKYVEIGGAAANNKTIASIPHGFGTDKLIVQVYDEDGYRVLVDTQVTDSDVSLTFSSPLETADLYSVYIYPVGETAIASNTVSYT